jgi:hypothetical protein
MLMWGSCLQEPPPNQMNKQPVEFDQAINYVNKIKVRQQLQEHWSSSNAVAAAVAGSASDNSSGSNSRHSRGCYKQ